MNAAIDACELGVRFYFDRQRRPVTPALAGLRRRVSESWGLRDLSFSIGPGESVALIGPSGAGKTTLLRSLAGIFVPDAGRLEVRGRVASLLSIDAGLLPRLTGRENCLLLAVLGGLSRAEARAAVARVKERSGLAEAFDRPVSSFSQGMSARLGYAVAEQTRPQVLLLDEVHEALDHEFRAIVEETAQKIVGSGGIVVAAGHDHPLLEQLCGRALLLRGGKVAADGAFLDVRAAYFAEAEMDGRAE